MAKSRNNVVTYGLSGIIGDLLLFRQRAGKTFVGKIPAKSSSLTLAQQNVRERFKEAVRYARAAITDPIVLKAYKEKAVPGQSAFNVAFADYFSKPEILQTDTSGYTGAPGSVIRILAADNFKVKSIKVTVFTSAGATLEQGDAVLDTDGVHWLYATQQTNNTPQGSRIVVTVADLPGNMVSAETIFGNISL